MIILRSIVNQGQIADDNQEAKLEMGIPIINNW